ncbi:MAG: protein phosphatase 2C domain-containing protein [Lachnospiraceae bacterium]|nr:protein phosphatase 2C domain-containing protein [Lachnospiraceae bacterium]
MRLRTGVYWSVGARYGKNQDSLSMQHVRLARGECLLAVVCDGIGSLKDAEEASGLAARLMTDWFYQEGKELICQNSSKAIILLALRGQILHIQEILNKFQQFKQIQTGTTMSALLIVRRRYYTVHIGDSRIYEIRRWSRFRRACQIRCLTQDDKNDKGELLKCLGVSGEDSARFSCGRIKRQRGFLLCTDGFYYAGEKRIGRVLGPLLPRGRRRGGIRLFRALRGCGKEMRKTADIDRRLELLGMQARLEGSRDNMTAVFVCAD